MKMTVITAMTVSLIFKSCNSLVSKSIKHIYSIYSILSDISADKTKSSEDVSALWRKGWS